MNMPPKELLEPGLYYEKRPIGPVADQHNRGTLLRFQHLSDGDFRQMVTANHVLEEFFQNMDRSIAAEEAFQEFKDSLNRLKSDNKYELARVDRRFRAYVLEFRMFLDHWDRHISHISNQKSKEDYKEIYKGITSSVYDECDEYALAYVIRNFVVHGDDAINKASINGKQNKVYISRDRLAEINPSASAKKVLSRQPEYIDLYQVGEKSMEALKKVQLVLVNFQIRSETSITNAIVTMRRMRKIINKNNIKSSLWMIVEQSKPGMLQGKPAQGLAYYRLNWEFVFVVANYIDKVKKLSAG